jgi:sugar phosphate isomerase/epimerase
MRLSCLPVSLFPLILSGAMTIRQWSLMAAGLALDAIDISILFLKSRSHDYLRNIRADIEGTGMHVAVCNTYPDLTHPDSDERIRQLSQLKSDIKAASFLGAKLVRITAGQAYPGIERRKGVAWVLEAFHEAARTAESEGIGLAYENHSKPGVWKYADFSHPTDVFLEIAEGIKDTSIGILFDTANPLAFGDDPIAVLEKVLDRVVCIHAADIYEKGTLRPALVGTGIVPLHDIFSRLHESGYEGFISIEEASGSGQEGIQKAVEYVREVWRDTSRFSKGVIE